MNRQTWCHVITTTSWHTYSNEEQQGLCLPLNTLSTCSPLSLSTYVGAMHVHRVSSTGVRTYVHNCTHTTDNDVHYSTRWNTDIDTRCHSLTSSLSYVCISNTCSLEWSSDISWRHCSFSATTLASCVDRSCFSFFSCSRRPSIWLVTTVTLFSSVSSSVTRSCATKRTDPCSTSCYCCWMLSAPCEGNTLRYPATSVHWTT